MKPLFSINIISQFRTNLAYCSRESEYSLRELSLHSTNGSCPQIIRLVLAWARLKSEREVKFVSFTKSCLKVQKLSHRMNSANAQWDLAFWKFRIDWKRWKGIGDVLKLLEKELRLIDWKTIDSIWKRFKSGAADLN